MMKCTSLFSILLVMGMSLLVHGCGKKSNEEKKKVERLPDQPISEWETTLNKQELICANGRGCPSYLTKIAIIENNKMKFCTGFLIKENTVATASSCLPEYLRLGNNLVPDADEQDCKKEITFFFYEPNQKPKRYECHKVKKATALNGKDPYLWGSDIAILEINETVSGRKVLGTTNSGMPNFTEHYIWSVDQIDENQGIIQKKDKCESVFGSYLNPFADSKSSPVMTVAGCMFTNGNSGSPVIFDGKLRGILSRPASQKSIDELKALRISDKPLKDIMYVSNYACAPGQDVADEAECFKELTVSRYDSLRKEMLSETKLFKDIIRRHETGFNETNRYLSLQVVLREVGAGYGMTVVPKCFKKSNEWLGAISNSTYNTSYLEVAELSLRRVMDEYGRISAKETVKGYNTTSFQFRPKDLKSYKVSDVISWDDTSTTRYPQITHCP